MTVHLFEFNNVATLDALPKNLTFTSPFNEISVLAVRIVMYIM